MVGNGISQDLRFFYTSTIFSGIPILTTTDIRSPTNY